MESLPREKLEFETQGDEQGVDTVMGRSIVDLAGAAPSGTDMARGGRPCGTPPGRRLERMPRHARSKVNSTSAIHASAMLRHAGKQLLVRRCHTTLTH